MSYPDYFTAADVPSILRDYPIGADFTARYTGMSGDELRSIQEAQFTRLMARGWAIPFYARHWGATGIEPGDIRGLVIRHGLPRTRRIDRKSVV